VPVDIAKILSHPWSLALALLFLILVLFPIEAVLNYLRDRIQVPRPRGLSRADIATWTQIANTPGPAGGRWIGALERAFLFLAILASVPTLLIAWLAFKVATKWEVWTNLYRVPDKLPRLNQMDFFLARTRLGARVFQRFMVGTLFNLGSALVAYLLFLALSERFPW